MRRDDDDRHVLVDQRDRPVLQLAGGIALGVDVGDFLELQRAFHGQRKVGAAAEIEHVACSARVRARPSRSGWSSFSTWLAIARRFGELRAPAPSPARRDRAARHAGAHGQRCQHRQLAGEGLGRGDADLRAGQGRQDHIGFARDGRFPHIDDRADRHACLAAIAQRGQRVGGLARLRDEQRGARSSTAAFRGSGIPRRHRCRPAAARSARTSICRPGRRDRRCRRRRWPGGRSWRNRTAASSGFDRAVGEIDIMASVCEITSGCSWISFSMKWRWLPLSTMKAGAERLLALALDRLAVHVEDLRRSLRRTTAQSPSSR